MLLYVVIGGDQAGSQEIGWLVSEPHQDVSVESEVLSPTAVSEVFPEVSDEWCQGAALRISHNRAG